MSFKTTVGKFGKFADKHSPEILLGAGIAGAIATVILSVTATPKAMKAIKEKKKKKQKTKLTPLETISAGWKYYIPALITGGASIAFLIGSNSVHNKREAAAYTLLATSEGIMHRYAEKVVETIGEKKENEIREETVKEIAESKSIPHENITITEYGSALFYDPYSDRCFTSSQDRISKVENEINRRLLNEIFVPLNEFYYELGLESTKAGAILGWHVDTGFLKIKAVEAKVVNDNWKSATVLDYAVSDKYVNSGRIAKNS